MQPISCRPATLSDAGDIHALLMAQAAEIPLLADTLEREEALYALVRNCARAGESWVAVDATGKIVGAVLAERAQDRRHYAEHEVIDLRYAVAPPAFGDVLDRLIGQVLGGMVPVVAAVSPQNRTGLAQRLNALGFRAEPPDARYRWQPG